MMKEFEFLNKSGQVVALLFDETATIREIAGGVRSKGMGCNCDLDNWEPQQSTGHSWVCRIHKKAVEIKNAL